MSDTLAPAIFASSVSTGVSVVILGIDTGLDYATLIAGVAGGAAALSYLMPDKALKRMYEVITASLLAGYTSPILTSICIHNLVRWGWMAPAEDGPAGLQLALAFLIAFLAHGGLLPAVRKLSEVIIRRYTRE